MTDLDRLVSDGRYPNRSRAEREKWSQLARELAKLNPTEEKRMAEEGLGDASRPQSCRKI